jgi:hypothetical protein
LWQQILKNKYLSQKTLAEVEGKPTDSPLWKGLMKVKGAFFSRGKFEIGSGEGVRFWEDKWLGDQTLASQYPQLYNIVHRKHDTVANVMSSTPLNIGFRRRLIGDKWDQWVHLCQRLMEITLNEEQDRFVWGLTQSGKFTVKSMYGDMINGQTRYLCKYLWKIKIPLKIKIFMWFLSKKVLLTRDNLAKRNWNGNTKCSFYDKEESVENWNGNTKPSNGCPGYFLPGYLAAY